MEASEFKRQIGGAHQRHHNEISDICRDYALSHNTVNIGDIVCDHVGSVRVVKIRHTNIITDLPQCVYFGQELTKKLVPRADASHRNVYQRNIIKS